ncbi:nitric oxide dioxygenase [Luteibacter sp. Sphag1AF]|uniref:NO-inducible flavohemoprotein n=1 Tax=Luteibacter sp. Sphag1AF TaxID=2587031 RepID=UPI00161D572B|nr:NO-inducible flavohemoprotein [Luteibacter sp. Sphag1AF]MBB3226744.1 nitric oxide dioxygenase [Luteibacter sp. Sphag1AF]
MLSAEHIAIVKATVPLLEAHGEVLTNHFYRLLLDKHPAMRSMFNNVRQANGEQARALSHRLLHYARNIDRMETLGPVISTICSKHVSKYVQPEHYAMVGACLIRTIRDVLGERTATDALIAAWSAAYAQFASILVGAEFQIYGGRERAPGGWRGLRPFVVVSRTMECREIVSLRLRPLDGGEVSQHVPGQYIGLSVTINDEEFRRNYSLSSAANGHTYRISVKREPGGRVSGYLHDHIGVGDVLSLYPPSGEFTLRDSDRPLALISAGVGITPMMAMLEAGMRAGRAINFIHAARERAVHAFRQHVDDLAVSYPLMRRFYCYERVEADDAAAEGLLTRERLREWLPDTRQLDVYVLGPLAFMRAVRVHLEAVGIPWTDVRYEFFGVASLMD